MLCISQKEENVNNEHLNKKVTEKCSARNISMGSEAIGMAYTLIPFFH